MCLAKKDFKTSKCLKHNKNFGYKIKERYKKNDSHMSGKKYKNMAFKKILPPFCFSHCL